MGIAQEILQDWHAAHAALQWQIDLGVEEWLMDEPINRYDLPETVKPAPSAAAVVQARAPEKRSAPPPPPEMPKINPAIEARNIASRAPTLEALREQLAGFDHCELKRGARNLIFAEGRVGAKVMVVTDAPTAEEDREGRAFVGLAGHLFEQMFAAIGLGRDSPDLETALYIAPALPWRTPGERAPHPEEVAMLHPFLERHIELAAPEVIVVMGNTPLAMLTGQRSLLQARGAWAEALGRPVLAMAHPAHLLRQPLAKREAWADLLALKAKLTA